MKNSILFFLVSCLLFLNLGTTINAQSKKQSNILLIVIDDLNDYTGFLSGHPQVKTPNMDALAKEGTVFTNAPIT